MVQSEQDADVTRHGLLRGDHGRDLRVHPALELIRLGILPAHLVGEVDVAIDHGALGALEGVHHPAPKAQYVVAERIELVVEGGAQRAPGGTLLGREGCDRLAFHQPNRPVM